mmetsp:Transcript_11088/g.43184  ORF Transcript_11088/g.43184 Transcript_11088/m.43184 type:complete len:211 (+) Transcript_11088:2038-2670(+)
MRHDAKRQTAGLQQHSEQPEPVPHRQLPRGTRVRRVIRTVRSRGGHRFVEVHQQHRGANHVGHNHASVRARHQPVPARHRGLERRRRRPRRRARTARVSAPPPRRSWTRWDLPPTTKRRRARPVRAPPPVRARARAESLGGARRRRFSRRWRRTTLTPRRGRSARSTPRSRRRRCPSWARRLPRISPAACPTPPSAPRCWSRCRWRSARR